MTYITRPIDKKKVLFYNDKACTFSVDEGRRRRAATRRRSATRLGHLLAASLNRHVLSSARRLPCHLCVAVVSCHVMSVTCRPSGVPRVTSVAAVSCHVTSVTCRPPDVPRVTVVSCHVTSVTCRLPDVPRVTSVSLSCHVTSVTCRLPDVPRVTSVLCRVIPVTRPVCPQSCRSCGGAWE